MKLKLTVFRNVGIYSSDAYYIYFPLTLPMKMELTVFRNVGIQNSDISYLHRL